MKKNLFFFFSFFFSLFLSLCTCVCLPHYLTLCCVYDTPMFIYFMPKMSIKYTIIPRKCVFTVRVQMNMTALRRFKYSRVIYNRAVLHTHSASHNMHLHWYLSTYYTMTMVVFVFISVFFFFIISFLFF